MDTFCLHNQEELVCDIVDNGHKVQVEEETLEAVEGVDAVIQAVTHITYNQLQR